MLVFINVHRNIIQELLKHIPFSTRQFLISRNMFPFVAMATEEQQRDVRCLLDDTHLKSGLTDHSSNAVLGVNRASGKELYLCFPTNNVRRNRIKINCTLRNTDVQRLKRKPLTRCKKGTKARNTTANKVQYYRVCSPPCSCCGTHSIGRPLTSCTDCTSEVIASRQCRAVAKGHFVVNGCFSSPIIILVVVYLRS